MDIATSNSAVTGQSTPVSVRPIPVESVENHLAPDWRPGETGRREGPASPLPLSCGSQRENLLELWLSLGGPWICVAVCQYLQRPPFYPAIL